MLCPLLACKVYLHCVETACGFEWKDNSFLYQFHHVVYLSFVNIDFNKTFSINNLFASTVQWYVVLHIQIFLTYFSIQRPYSSISENLCLRFFFLIDHLGVMKLSSAPLCFSSFLDLILRHLGSWGFSFVFCWMLLYSVLSFVIYLYLLSVLWV